MSQISKALKKVQELRRDQLEPNPEKIVFLTDAPKSWLKTSLMAILAVGTVTAILVGIAAISVASNDSTLKQARILSLEKTIKNQEKRIDDFIIAINKNQNFTDDQIHDLNLRLNKESNENKDVKAQIDSLASSDRTQYDNFKEAIIDDKMQIDSLDKYTKALDQKIEAFSATITQTKE